MEIRPLTPWLGAEAQGVDARGLDDATASALKAALHEHGVLVLRGQSLSPEDLVAVGRRFGPVEYGVREDYQLPTNRDVYVISNIVENGRPVGNPYDGFAWHTDLSFLEHPTAYTFLYALETPPEGGNTEFASGFVAYESLPPDRRAELDRIQVRHSYAVLHATRKWAAPLTEEQKRRFPDVIHPLVRTHPGTGRKALYLGPNTSLPLGLDEAASNRLIHELLAHAVQPDRIYAHRWQPGDLVIWDNHGLLHRATEYDRQRYRRLLHRVTVRGERPV